jgi:hypothetical protein
MVRIEQQRLLYSVGVVADFQATEAPVDLAIVEYVNEVH